MENPNPNESNEVKKKVGVGSWDAGIDFEKAYAEILNLHLLTRRKETKAYSAILLTQLRNGSRIGEAVVAFKLWIKTGEKILEIPCEKKKKKPETRIMAIPKPLLKEDRKQYEWLLNENDYFIKKRIVVFAKQHFHYNTHSLRYAWINYQLKKGIDLTAISKALHHSDLKFLLTYTQQKRGNELIINDDKW